MQALKTVSNRVFTVLSGGPNSPAFSSLVAVMNYLISTPNVLPVKLGQFVSAHPTDALKVRRASVP